MPLFEDITNPDALRRERLVRRLLIAAAILLILAAAGYWRFKNYPQERAAKRFFAALQANDLRGAYQIWKPTPTYTFADFQRDWGPASEYGRIQNFRLVTSHARGTDVVVTMDVNGRKTQLWVRRSDNSLSFPPF